MNSIKSIKLTVFSPQDIARHSFGEITSHKVLNKGLTRLLKNGEILEKRIDRPLISSILQEIIENKKLEKNIIEEAKELNGRITEKNSGEVVDTVFLEDYLDFLAKHCGIK